MKKLALLMSTFCCIAAGYAQETTSYRELQNNVLLNNNNVINENIPLNATTHIISPEPILYVDISTPSVEGDMPEKNIFRLKADTTKMKIGDSFTITVVSNSYVAVYKLTFADKKGSYVFSINPNNCVALNQFNTLTKQQCYDLSLKAMNIKRDIYNVQAKAYDLSIWVNNIFIIGDYLLFDIGAKNKSKIQYNVDQIRFKIRDKFVVNATVSQDIELQPIYQFYNAKNATIKREWRNFYIFKKFTFPTQKLFNIEFNEEQISGRKTELNIDYGQVLNASNLY